MPPQTPGRARFVVRQRCVTLRRHFNRLPRLFATAFRVMSLIRFDATGSLDADDGITADQIESLADRLVRYQTEFAGDQPIDTPGDSAGKESSEKRFFGLPEQQLVDYERDRQNSVLGRIFRVANGLHDHIDAVAVLGAGGFSSGARAMMHACCDPMHNELTRAQRGSKPRMYFDGDSFDNDASASLISRLFSAEDGNTPAERRWAICVASPSGETLETAVNFRQFLATLEITLGSDASTWLRRLVIPVTGPSGKLRELAQGIGCDEVFDVPVGIDDGFSVLSPVGLLPAAMLGLDCMRLLAGAAAMNDHFKNAAYADNMVLQYVAVNHLLQTKQDKTIRVMSVSAKALESVGIWYGGLVSGTLGHDQLGVTPQTRVVTRDLHCHGKQDSIGRNDKVFNHVTVENHRHDLVGVGNSNRNQDGLNDISDRTLTELADSAIDQFNRTMTDNGRPTTNIVLPTIDTYALGQLFQMLMIATAVEGRLIGVDPERAGGPHETSGA